jgi:hypothetical protein
MSVLQKFIPMEKRRQIACALSNLQKIKLLLGRRTLAARHIRQHRATAVAARHHHRKSNGREHEDNRGPGRKLRQQVALLNQNDADKKQTNDHVQNNEKYQHGWNSAFSAASAAK